MSIFKDQQPLPAVLGAASIAFLGKAIQTGKNVALPQQRAKGARSLVQRNITKTFGESSSSKAQLGRQISEACGWLFASFVSGYLAVKSQMSYQPPAPPAPEPVTYNSVVLDKLYNNSQALTEPVNQFLDQVHNQTGGSLAPIGTKIAQAADLGGQGIAYLNKQLDAVFKWMGITPASSDFTEVFKLSVDTAVVTLPLIGTVKAGSALSSLIGGGRVFPVVPQVQVPAGMETVVAKIGGAQKWESLRQALADNPLVTTIIALKGVLGTSNTPKPHLDQMGAKHLQFLHRDDPEAGGEYYTYYDPTSHTLLAQGADISSAVPLTVEELVSLVTASTEGGMNNPNSVAFVKAHLQARVNQLNSSTTASKTGSSKVEVGDSTENDTQFNNALERVIGYDEKAKQFTFVTLDSTGAIQRDTEGRLITSTGTLIDLGLCSVVDPKLVEKAYTNALIARVNRIQSNAEGEEALSEVQQQAHAEYIQQIKEQEAIALKKLFSDVQNRVVGFNEETEKFTLVLVDEGGKPSVDDKGLLETNEFTLDEMGFDKVTEDQKKAYLAVLKARQNLVQHAHVPLVNSQVLSAVQRNYMAPAIEAKKQETETRVQQETLRNLFSDVQNRVVGFDEETQEFALVTSGGGSEKLTLDEMGFNKATKDQKEAYLAALKARLNLVQHAHVPAVGKALSSAQKEYAGKALNSLFADFREKVVGFDEATQEFVIVTSTGETEKLTLSQMGLNKATAEQKAHYLNQLKVRVKLVNHKKVLEGFGMLSEVQKAYVAPELSGELMKTLLLPNILDIDLKTGKYHVITTGTDGIPELDDGQLLVEDFDIKDLPFEHLSKVTREAYLANLEARAKLYNFVDQGIFRLQKETVGHRDTLVNVFNSLSKNQQAFLKQKHPGFKFEKIPPVEAQELDQAGFEAFVVKEGVGAGSKGQEEAKSTKGLAHQPPATEQGSSVVSLKPKELPNPTPQKLGDLLHQVYSYDPEENTVQYITKDGSDPVASVSLPFKLSDDQKSLLNINSFVMGHGEFFQGSGSINFDNFFNNQSFANLSEGQVNFLEKRLGKHSKYLEKVKEKRAADIEAAEKAKQAALEKARNEKDADTVSILAVPFYILGQLAQKHVVDPATAKLSEVGSAATEAAKGGAQQLKERVVGTPAEGTGHGGGAEDDSVLERAAGAVNGVLEAMLTPFVKAGDAAAALNNKWEKGKAKAGAFATAAGKAALDVAKEVLRDSGLGTTREEIEAREQQEEAKAQAAAEAKQAAEAAKALDEASALFEVEPVQYDETFAQMHGFKDLVKCIGNQYQVNTKQKVRVILADGKTKIFNLAKLGFKGEHALSHREKFLLDQRGLSMQRAFLPDCKTLAIFSPLQINSLLTNLKANGQSRYSDADRRNRSNKQLAADFKAKYLADVKKSEKYKAWQQSELGKAASQAGGAARAVAGGVGSVFSFLGEVLDVAAVARNAAE